MQKYDYEFYEKSAKFILSQLPEKPQVALILGSALGSLGDEIEDPIVIDYAQIPNFLISTVQSHAGKMICGKLGGKYVIVMSGRFHYYEGYSFEQLAAPIRVFKIIGVKSTILTNAAGIINEKFNVGDIMIIDDHIKLTPDNPTRGPNEEKFGKRFYDVSDTYTKSIADKAQKIAVELGQAATTRRGVYFYASGPNFETAAEIRAMRILGADAVGMSTVTEALTAAHCEMPLLGLSLLSNFATGVVPGAVDGEEVDVVGRQSSGRFKALVRKIVEEL